MTCKKRRIELSWIFRWHSMAPIGINQFVWISLAMILITKHSVSNLYIVLSQHKMRCSNTVLTTRNLFSCPTCLEAHTQLQVKIEIKYNYNLTCTGDHINIPDPERSEVNRCPLRWWIKELKRACRLTLWMRVGVESCMHAVPFQPMISIGAPMSPWPILTLRWWSWLGRGKKTARILN